MSTNSTKDNLTAEIDNAVDNLFSAYEQGGQKSTSPKPQSPEVKPASQPPSPSQAGTVAAAPVLEPEGVELPTKEAILSEPDSISLEAPKPPTSSLEAEIDGAVEDLFGFDEGEQESAAPQASPQATAVPEAPAPEPISLETPKPPPSALEAEIDNAVEDLFGSYEGKQESAAPQAPPQPPSTPQAPAVPEPPVLEPVEAGLSEPEPISLETPKPPPSALETEIDNAVEDLFSPYEGKQESAVPPAPPQPPPAPPAAAVPGPPALEPETQAITLDLEEEPAQKTSAPPDLWGQLDQALLTIEWEVTASNVATATSKLNALRNSLDLDKNDTFKKIVDLMGRVLHAMSVAPQNVPTSAPQALKKGMRTLLKAFHLGDKLDEQTKNSIQSVITGLSATLSADSGVEPYSTPTADITKKLHSHLSVLDQCIKRLSSAEQVFAKNPNFKKLQAIEKKTRLQLEAQKSAISKALPTFAENGNASLVNTLQSHAAVLEQCRNRLEPLEKLFSKKPAYGKLCTLHQKLREQFARQQQLLINIVAAPPPQSAEAASDQLEIIEEIQPEMLLTPAPDAQEETVSTAPQFHEAAGMQAGAGTGYCPWKTLQLGKWKGKTVAFAPEQIACERKASKWAKKHMARIAAFPFKKLKRWPFQRLHSMFRGELGKQEEFYLTQLQYPVLNYVEAVQNLSKPTKSAKILVLYHSAKGGVLLLDGPTQKITVSQAWRWDASTQRGSLVAGHITIKANQIPVISITKL